MDIKKKYSYDDIYEMLGGECYYPICQIKYIYHMTNNEYSLAKPYLEEFNKYNAKLDEMYQKMKANTNLNIDTETEKNNIDNNNDE